jgi:hypothetical protein
MKSFYIQTNPRPSVESQREQEGELTDDDRLVIEVITELQMEALTTQNPTH